MQGFEVGGRLEGSKKEVQIYPKRKAYQIIYHKKSAASRIIIKIIELKLKI